MLLEPPRSRPRRAATTGGGSAGPPTGRVLRWPKANAIPTVFAVLLDACAHRVPKEQWPKLLAASAKLRGDGQEGLPLARPVCHRTS